MKIYMKEKRNNEISYEKKKYIWINGNALFEKQLCAANYDKIFEFH